MKKLTKEKNTYNYFTNITVILQNNPKDLEGFIVTIFGFEVDITKFIAWISKDKFETVLKVIIKIFFFYSVVLMDT